MRIWLGRELTPNRLNGCDFGVDVPDVIEGFDSPENHITDGGDDDSACFVLVILSNRNTDDVEDRQLKRRMAMVDF